MPNFPESHFPDHDLENVISFFTEDIDFQLEQEDALRLWIKAVVERENGILHQINYIFCSDDYLHQLNVKYLDHDTLTDIITFPYNDFPNVQGDIFISLDRVRENASTLHLSFAQEFYRVIIHGVLHLCDYGDKGEQEAKQMRAKEDEMLSLAQQFSLQL